MSKDWSEAKAHRVLRAAFGKGWLVMVDHAPEWVGCDEKYGASLYLGAVRVEPDQYFVTFRVACLACIKAAEKAGIPINAKWKAVADA
jgi:hypothetical protein